MHHKLGFGKAKMQFDYIKERKKLKADFQNFPLFIANNTLNRDTLTLCGCSWWAASVFNFLKGFDSPNKSYSK